MDIYNQLKSVRSTAKKFLGVDTQMSAYFTLPERYKLETMLQDKIPVKDIAQRLNKHFTTVYREIKRGTVLLRNGSTWEDVPTYCADVAQRKQCCPSN